MANSQTHRDKSPLYSPLQVNHEESQRVSVGLGQLTHSLVHGRYAVVLICDFCKWKESTKRPRLLSLDKRFPSYRPQSLIYTVSFWNFWLGSWLHQSLVSLTSRLLANSSILEIRTLKKKQLLQFRRAAGNSCFQEGRRITAVYNYQEGTCSQNMLRAYQVPGAVLSAQHQAELNKSPCPILQEESIRKKIPIRQWYI